MWNAFLSRTWLVLNINLQIITGFQTELERLFIRDLTTEKNSVKGSLELTLKQSPQGS